jgi:DNA mismatch repair ATPase MutS
MLSGAVWQFARMDFLYDAFEPLTPQGKRVKRSRRFITDAGELARQYDLTDAALALGERRADEMDRVEYHLKRVGDLAGLSELAALGSADVFVVKKFLLNYRAVVNLLDEKTRSAFGLRFALDDLLSQLDVEDAGTESFHVSDRYRTDLHDLRRQLWAADDDLKDLRAEMHARLLDESGLDFRFREFLVVPNAGAAALSRERFFIEPHDNANVIVRPAMSRALLDKHALRDKLARKEQKIEQEVLADLASRIVANLDELHRCAELLGQFDVSLARARLSRSFALLRPEIRPPGGAVEAVGARLPALEDACSRSRLRYWPTDLAMSEPHGVVFGSNMCGKTVVLQTLAFCQVAAQMGFFVPAKRFATTVFDGVFFVGPSPASARQAEEGLSSFGAEIVEISRALEARCERKLLFVDEFARTTNSKEAVALLSGLLAWLAERDGVRMLMATHYRPLPRLSGVAYYVMKGLTWDRFEKKYADQLEADPHAPLAERVRNIQECIEYEVLVDTEGTRAYDALHVAAALGLDSDIVALAEQYAERDRPESSGHEE